jgi:hypothetical protein
MDADKIVEGSDDWDHHRLGINGVLGGTGEKAPATFHDPKYSFEDIASLRMTQIEQLFTVFWPKNGKYQSTPHSMHSELTVDELCPIP